MPQDPFYSSGQWRDFRRAFIRAYPVCCRDGCGKPTKHVDHIKARSKGGAPLDPENCQPLCHSHHSQKTARVDGGFGNAPSTKGVDVEGWPLDSGRQ